MEFRISDKMTGVQGSVIRELFKLMSDPNLIAFSGGNPSPDTFPTADIARIAADVLTNQPVSVLQYGFSEGYPPLRETLKDYLARTEGFDFEQNELMIVSGGQQVADLAAKILLNEGDVVISEEPSFVGCLNAFRSYGARLAGAPMRPDGMDLDALEQALKTNDRARMLYVIPSFQNPTGYTTGVEKRRAIYELARRHDIVILEDNPYGELRFSGERVPTIKSMDVDGRVIYGGSFSKVMAPAFRLGFAVFDKALAAKMSVAKQCTDVHSNVLYQHICNEYMTKCDFAGHLAQSRALYRKKAGLMLGEMEKKFAPGMTYNRPEGGLFVMAFLPEGIDSNPFVQEGIRRGVATIPGAAFLTDQKAVSNGFRMNFATPSEDDILRGVGILGKLTHEWLQK